MNITLNTNNAKMDNDWWHQVFRLLAHRCSLFRVHCWSDEVSEISMMQQFGHVSTTSWKHGVIIEGKITNAFIDSVTSLCVVTQRIGYNIMTPFFIIELDNIFSSSHYGTEVFISNLCPDTMQDIDNILSDIKSDLEISKN